MSGPARISVSPPSASISFSAARSTNSDEEPARVVPPMPRMKGLAMSASRNEDGAAREQARVHPGIGFVQRVEADLDHVRVHQSVPRQPDDIAQVRRGAGIGDRDAGIARHLMEAQRQRASPDTDDLELAA